MKAASEARMRDFLFGVLAATGVLAMAVGVAMAAALIAGRHDVLAFALKFPGLFVPAALVIVATTLAMVGLARPRPAAFLGAALALAPYLAAHFPGGLLPLPMA
jgi:hypothetical protein